MAGELDGTGIIERNEGNALTIYARYTPIIAFNLATPKNNFSLQLYKIKPMQFL